MIHKRIQLEVQDVHSWDVPSTVGPQRYEHLGKLGVRNCEMFISLKFVYIYDLYHISIYIYIYISIYIYIYIYILCMHVQGSQYLMSAASQVVTGEGITLSF